MNDEEFSTYGYVSNIYGGSITREPTYKVCTYERGTLEYTRMIYEEESNVIITPYEDKPLPVKVLIGEKLITNYYYEPTNPCEKERIRIARLLLSGAVGSTPNMELLEQGYPLPGKPEELLINDEVENYGGVIVANSEILSNTFDNLVLSKDISDSKEFIFLNFLGCPTIELGIDELGMLCVLETRGVLEALSILFGNPLIVFT